MSVLRIELRRGVPLWSLPILVAAMLLVLFVDNKYRMAEWAGATSQLRTCLILVGPVVVATATWQAGRERRRGMSEFLASTPRPRLQRVVGAWAPVVIWALLAYLVGVLVAIALTAPRTSYGHLWIDLVGAGAAAIAALAALGFVLGWYIPWRGTAPVAGLATFLAMGVVASAPVEIQVGTGTAPDPPYAAFLTPVLSISWGEQPAAWLGTLSMLWFLGLATALLLATAARGRWRAAIPLMVAGLAAVPLIAFRGDAVVANPGSLRLVCSDGTPEVCVRAVHADMLGDATDAIRDLTRRLDGVPDMPTRYVERDPNPWSYPNDDESSELSFTTSGWDLGNPQVLRRDVADRLFGYTCLRTMKDDISVEGLPLGVRAWFLELSVPETQSPYRALTADLHWVAENVRASLVQMPPEARTAWLGGYRQALRTCTLSQVTMP